MEQAMQRKYWSFVMLATLVVAVVAVMLLSSSARAACTKVCGLCGGGVCCTWQCGASTSYPTGPASTGVPAATACTPAPTGATGTVVPTRTPGTPAPTATPCPAQGGCAGGNPNKESPSSLSERAAGWPAPMMVNSCAWPENSKRLITKLLCIKR